jgi:transglutaminase-like putative cysteine protease
MKIEIKHSTRYRYAKPIGLLPHRLLLSPRNDQHLKTSSFSIACSPEGLIDWSQDVFGNMVATASFHEQTPELTITSTAVVEQNAEQWPVFKIDPSAHSFPFDYAQSDLTDLGAFTVATLPVGWVSSWGEKFVVSRPTDTLSLLKDINTGMLGKVSYRTRDEEGTQSPLETLELGSGSCRDIAALFIEVVRGLGFGARAVSGYVHDPEASVDDGGSTHAWAEVFLPGAGWIAFDPTHRRVGESSLIPVAVARNNAQIMPVTGGYVGKPEDFDSMEVTVKTTSYP